MIVLDTSVILNNPRIIKEFKNSNIVVPLTTLNELSEKKNLKNELGKNARTFFRNYMHLRKEQGSDRLDKGIRYELNDNSSLILELNHTSTKLTKDLFGELDNDLRILSVVLNYAEELKKNTVKLYTNDYELILRADLAKEILRLDNITAINYNQNDDGKKDYNEIYSGKDEYFVTENFVQKFREDKNRRISKEELLKEIQTKDVGLNQFIICKSKYNEKNRIIGRLVVEKGVEHFRLIKQFDKTEVLGITASRENIDQQMFLDLVMDEQLDFISAIGSAGTGKTLLSLASSIKQVQSGSRFKRILLLRPDELVGKGQGFLPGDLIKKNDPLFKPVYDNLTKIINLNKASKNDEYNVINNIEEAKDYYPFIDIESISYIRGRTIDNAVIIVEEAANLSVEQAITIITRAGKNSKVIFTGDIHQIDNPYNDEVNNGHVYVMERLKDNEITAGIVLSAESGERSRLTNLAIKKLYPNKNEE